MSNSRTTIRKIDPGNRAYDSDFWPVLVALAVLCGIAFGAILTLLKGPWMWGSLLLLPALAAMAILFLYRLDDNRLRRSLQFSIIVSLAAHLAVLILASVFNIFNTNIKVDEQPVARRQNKTILISDRQVPFVWEQVNQRETPDPTVQTEKQQTVVEPQKQPIPVKNQKTEINPQLVRREQAAKSVPRLDKDLSQLRRQDRELTPKSSVKSQSLPQVNKQTAKASEPSPSVKVDRQSSNTVAQRTDNKPKTSEVQANHSRVAERNTQSRPQAKANRPDPSIQSTARLRRTTPKIPVSRPNKSIQTTAKQPTQTRNPDLMPTKSANQVTRRQITSRRPNNAPANKATTNNTGKKQIAKSSEKRQRQTQSSISNNQTPKPNVRRSSTLAPTPTSIANLESPSLAPRSSSDSRQLSAKTQSVSRGETGVTGATRGKNLARDMGGAASPAVQPSDSVARRATENTASESRMLNASQESTTRRSIAAAKTPEFAFKADTIASAKISGSKTPSERTMPASAAALTSSTADNRAQVAVQKGEASVDIGPQKIVADKTAQRRSGGGQPEVAQLNPSETRRSDKSSNDRMPSLAADLANLTGAPADPAGDSEAAFEPQPNATALTQSRSSSDDGNMSEMATSEVMGENQDQGTNQLAQQLADSRSRSDVDQPLDSGDSEDDEDERLMGNSSGRVAQAPLVRNSTDLGDARFSEGLEATEAQADGQSIAAKVVERAAGTIAGSITRSTASQVIQAAATLPLIDSTPAKRTSRGNDQSGTNGELVAKVEGIANRRSKTNSRLPNVKGTSEQIMSLENVASESEAVVESAAAAIERTQSTDGAALRIDAPEGAAGLGNVVSKSLGVRTRPATESSRQIQPDMSQRFKREHFGGNPAVSPDASLAKEAFRQRQPATVSSAEPSTEKAIYLGLEFLARNQLPDGSWALQSFDVNHPLNQTKLQSDTAATGLCLLAFQGAGYSHKEFKYARQMNHALEWLVSKQAADGGLYIKAGNKSDQYNQMYSHAIATLALTEAYGMTQDPALREPAQRALNYIAKTQDPKKGGWRYYPELARRKSDTSVTGWMMMSLQSGRLSGLEVQQSTLDGINNWLGVAADSSNQSLFRYNPFGKDSLEDSRAKGRGTSPSMTSVGLLMRIYSGWNRNDLRLTNGAQDLLDKQMPSDANSIVRDTYYWYYATQVFKHIDGPMWEEWYGQLHPLLVNSQIKTGEMAGSWHPFEPVPDRWGQHAGRLYVTTMNLLSLEVRHRLLPLYDDTSE